MSILLEQGNRGLLVGKTGSGKSQNAMFHLRHTDIWPKVIFDTKIEDFFFSVPEDGEHMEIANSVGELRDIAKREPRYAPDYILVRPSAEEVQAFEPMDAYTQFVYNNFGKCFIYFDELTNWHRHNLCGAGLINILTRGRSRGKTTLMASQRPAWISRSCLTESDKFYIHRLQDARDVKTLADVVPEIERVKLAPKFHFHHYDTGADMETPQLYKPVPYTPIDKKKIFKRKWV
jgi:hypothetical protein